MFKSVIRAHTELLLNPFFEPSEGGGVDNDMLECFDEEEEEAIDPTKSLAYTLGNQRYTDVLNHKLSEVALFFEKFF